MIEDKNKGITAIAYNHLNLPRLITFGNGNTIEYIYDASGVKLQKIVKESGQADKTTDYVGGMVYEDNARKFIATEEGRIMLESTPEYQYHMKDHLGNVRLTFTTASSAQQTSTYMATMEPEATTLEAATFNNIETTQQEDKIYNHTPGGKASARLNAAEDRVMGPSMTLHVMPGDTVRMQVQAKYFKKAKKKDPIAGMAAIVAASVGVGSIGEAPQIASGLQETLGMGQAGLVSKDNTIPKAYINYMFYDKDNTFRKGGFKQVSEAALGSFEELTLEYVPEEEGTMMVYTANQTAEPLDVYMDDMRVAHIEGPIIRVDDYYPFGLTFNSSERSGFTTNNFLYNGKELQTDLDLDWYDYGARMYNAAIGRWHVVDRLAEEYHDVGPYLYSMNNPVRFVDPDGNQVWDMTTDKAHKSAMVRFASTEQGKRFLAQYAKAGDVIGGIKFERDGKYSHQNVAFYSSSTLPKKYSGITRLFLRTEQSQRGLELGHVGKGTVKDNLGGLDKLAFSVDIRNGLTEDQALETIGHESFIHVEKTTKDVEQGILDLNDGKFGRGEELLGNFASFMSGLQGDKSDHKLAVDGKVATMEEFVDALDQVTGGSKFRDMYSSWKDAERKRLEDGK
ncbi:MAG: RHS repeat-associated core domain-containing protein [Cyclobacteriaceae bacterium]|nr:RHS repeat-associated core domain-containing protein [Cyclobacteriaceae bacterium]